MTLSRLSALASARRPSRHAGARRLPSPGPEGTEAAGSRARPVKAVGTPATRSVGASPAKPGDPTYRYDMYYSDLLDARTKRG